MDLSDFRDEMGESGQVIKSEATQVETTIE
jgi:hypothetical protein